MKEILTLKELSEHKYQFFKFISEDKSKYRKASDDGFIDQDNSFLIGESGGFLMNIDFIFINTHVFSEVAKFYEERGCYTYSIHGSPDYTKFWARETHRRRYGMTGNCKLYYKDIDDYFNPDLSDEYKDTLLHPLHIPGDFYNFLNYGRIYRTLRPEEKKQYEGRRGKIPKKKYGFPNFIDGQYWNFKIDEFIYNNEYHLCKSKRRRAGFSFMRGSQAANTLNLNKNLTVMLAAYDLSYLTSPGATTDMVKRNLDWYEEQTYWQRGYLSEDYQAIELGYRTQKGANKKFGWRSKLLSVGTRNNESAAIGKDPFELDCEEAGKFPNLGSFLDVTTSAAEDGDLKIGTIRIYGTGGTKDANWEAFSKIFFAPEAFEMMPFENVWDDNLRHTTCGFFYPQSWGYGSMVDEHGNSMLIKSYEHDLKRKEEYRKRNTDAKTIIFTSQRAQRPSEAFLNTKDNIFSSVALNKWIVRLKYDPDVSFYKDGMFSRDKEENPIFKTNEQLKREGKITHEFITDVPIKTNTDITGCFRMIYEPYTISGKVPDDLYFITNDSAAIDKDRKDLTIKHSLNSFKVWMRTNNSTPFPGKRLVGAYCGRFDTLKANDEILLLACLFYNAKVLPEVPRGETVANFKQWAYITRLLKDPKGLISKGRYSANAGYGMTIGDGDTKMEGLLKLKELIYTPMGIDDNEEPIYFLHYIYDVSFLLELQRFYIDGNFDRISDAILAAYQFKVYDIREEKRRKEENSRDSHRLINSLLYYD